MKNNKEIMNDIMGCENLGFLMDEDDIKKRIDEIEEQLTLLYSSDEDLPSIGKRCVENLEKDLIRLKEEYPDGYEGTGSLFGYSKERLLKKRG